MQRIGDYLVLLVIGALVGASAMAFLTVSSNNEEEVKVAVHGITYRLSDSVLEFELLNDIPERYLDGQLIVLQDEKEWSSDVDWNRVGYGKAEVLCEAIDETRDFRVIYVENYFGVKCLDRIITWDEVVVSISGSTPGETRS